MTALGEHEGQRLAQLGEAFGDPTRRAVYAFVADDEEPVTATETSARIGIHRTVARAHLEKLVEAGLLGWATRRRPGGGRPAKVYFRSGRLEVQVPPRRYERLARLLLEVVATMPAAGPAAGRAHEAAYALGRAVARSQPDGDTAARPGGVGLEAAASWLAAEGYAVRVERSSPQRSAIEIANCVYHEVAEIAPSIVCACDSGLLCGLLAAGESEHAQTRCIVTGDPTCRHEFVF
jgi:predicted ArsR family transcriptional regulator